MTALGRFGRPVLRGGILAAVLALFAPVAGAQTTVNLVVAKDATIRGGSYASTRHGSQTYLATRRSDRNGAGESTAAIRRAASG